MLKFEWSIKRDITETPFPIKLSEYQDFKSCRPRLSGCKPERAGYYNQNRFMNFKQLHY